MGSMRLCLFFAMTMLSLSGCEPLLSELLEPKKSTAELQRQEFACKVGSTDVRCYDLKEGEAPHRKY